MSKLRNLKKKKQIAKRFKEIYLQQRAGDLAARTSIARDIVTVWFLTEADRI